MQDRVPLYPGRVVLTPVSGQANTYDMTRADQPTQEGTPLNKASLLKDATAALYGLGTDAVPDDALSAINTLIQAAQTTADGKSTIVTGSYVGTGQSGPSNPNILDFDEPPKIIFIVPERNTDSYSMGILFPPYGAKTFIFGPNIQSYYRGLTVSLSGGTVKYYSSEAASDQLNNSGKVFHYYALF